MSKTFQDILTQGKVSELPQCELCNVNEKDQKETLGQEKAFLVLYKGKLVCGKCALKMSLGKVCVECSFNNIYDAKFCVNCGGRFL